MMAIIAVGAMAFACIALGVWLLVDARDRYRRTSIYYPDS